MVSPPFVSGQVLWLYKIPQILVLIFLFWAFSFTDDSASVLYAVVAYWLLIYLLRHFLAKDHRKGVRVIKSNKFEEAIVCFGKSVKYFERNPWVDKYRYVTLLSSSKMTYREMGLCNIAFSLTQLGRGAEAKDIYNEVITQYPQNSLAPAALKMMSAG